MKRFTLVIILALLTTFHGGCSEATELLRADTLFDIELGPGDLITFEGAVDSAIFEGPLVTKYHWSNGSLYMNDGVRNICIRPIIEQGSQQPSESQISQLMQIYPNVPYIQALQPSTPSQWYQAYCAWNETKTELETQAKQFYIQDQRTDRAQVAREISEIFRNSELVIAESVAVSNDQSDNQQISLIYQGAMTDLQGNPVMTFVSLENEDATLQPPADYISFEDALSIHHSIWRHLQITEGPAIIELGSGWFAGRRR
jgi:hypothetical protein